MRALFALRNIGGKDSVDALAAAYDSKSALLKHEIAYVMGQMQNPHAVPHLIERLEDGEEFDIDDVIEAFVDIKTGVSPSEKLYWRRNKIQRDVACVFLLDVSASTAESIEDSNTSNDWDVPDDPVDYMKWIKSRRKSGIVRTYKRIIDLEKEASVLLIDALENLGDQYGICL